MKYILLGISMLANSPAVFAVNGMAKIIEKDINAIPQCKDQNSEECKEIKQQIKEFCDLLDAANIDAVIDQEVVELMKYRHYEQIKLITLYLESKKRNDNNLTFKEYRTRYHHKKMGELLKKCRCAGFVHC